MFTLVMAAAALASGCLQPSLNPLIPIEDSVFDEGLLGAWRCGSETWTFARDTENDLGPKAHYLVHVRTGDKQGDIVAWLGRLDDGLYINFAPAFDIPVPSDFFDGNVIATFTFGRITTEPGRLRLAMLDSAWIERAYAAGLLPIGVRQVWPGAGPDDLSILLTADSKALQRFVRAFAGDDRVFPHTLELARVAAEANSNSNEAGGGSCDLGR